MNSSAVKLIEYVDLTFIPNKNYIQSTMLETNQPFRDGEIDLLVKSTKLDPPWTTVVSSRIAHIVVARI